MLAAAIGGMIAGTLGAYYKSFWTEKGKNLATYEDIKTLLAEERGKAYEQEKGKQLATHEDIENVLKEVKAVTRETETIKAQIGHDHWIRQTVWNQKLIVYTDLLATIPARCGLLGQLLTNLQDGSTDAKQVAVLGKLIENGAIFARNIFQGHIFLSPRATAELLNETLLTPPLTPEACQTGIDALNRLQAYLIVEAKSDLEVLPHPPS